MSFDLSKVFDEKLNLYDILEISIPDDPKNVEPAQIKKQYRSLALMYHPDKHPNNPDIVHKFHLLSLATHILTEETSRSAYDKWLTRFIKTKTDKNDQQREEFINKLNRLESEAQNEGPNKWANDLSSVQEYGETLRKFKHFKISYGDWESPKISSSEEQLSSKHKFYESATLRMEIENTSSDVIVSNKKNLVGYLENIFQGMKMYDIYYSSRNNFANDTIIVAYTVFQSPRDSQRIFKSWRAGSRKDWGLIIDIAPRIPVRYYKDFNIETELDPEIANLLSNSPIIID